MYRPGVAVLFVGVAFLLSIHQWMPVHAPLLSRNSTRPCAQSANNPEAGPTAPQSIAAQLEHQPTPGSVKRAEERAEAAFEVALTGAKRTQDIE
jgi:hypothetical protein